MPDSEEEPTYRLMFKAFCWIDDGIRNILRQATGFEATKTETMMILLIRSGVTRSSDLAQHLGITRQGVHKAVTKLEAAKVLKLSAHPDDNRSKQLVMMDSDTPMHQVVTEGLEHIDDLLKQRLGEKGFRHLIGELSKDWGPIPGCEVDRN